MTNDKSFRQTHRNITNAAHEKGVTIFIRQKKTECKIHNSIDEGKHIKMKKLTGQLLKKISLKQR